MERVPTLCLFFSLCCFLSCKSAEWRETAFVGEPLPLSLPALGVVTSVDSGTEPFSVSHGLALLCPGFVSVSDIGEA